MAVFAVTNYTGVDDYELTIATDAMIFRDKVGWNNYHVAASDTNDQIIHTYKNGVCTVS